MHITPDAIAFDFDGVVADTFRLFVQLAEIEFGISIVYEEITDYDFLNVIPMDAQTATYLLDKITDFAHTLDLLPNHGAPATLTRLSQNTALLFVTARSELAPVQGWFQKTMPHIRSAIHIEATGSNTTKLPVLKERGIRYFVEDRLDTCEQLAEAGIIPIVYDQPWNRKPHPFIVVKDWEDIAQLIAW